MKYIIGTLTQSDVDEFVEHLENKNFYLGDDERIFIDLFVKWLNHDNSEYLSARDLEEHLK